jgi:hypothetical protein
LKVQLQVVCDFDLHFLSQRSFETLRNVQRVTAEKSFDVKKWQGEADRYSLSVKNGEVEANGSDHGI